MILFAWVPVLVGVIEVIIIWITMTTDCRYGELPYRRIFPLLMLVLCTTLISVLIQMMLNYSILFYAGYNYGQLIIDEVNLRSTSCWLAAERAAVDNMVASLLSILL